MKAIFVLCDSLNRRFLNCYGAEEAALTPNLDRLCERSVVFDNHWVGSSPCMPARRDIMTGRLNFLERPWGGIEPYDHTLQRILSDHNIYSRMETDHYCYSVAGGENYWKDFTTWRLHRGQQCDKWDTRPTKAGKPPADAAPAAGKGYRKTVYDDTRRRFARDDDFPTPRTFSSAAGWLEQNHAADNFLLWVEGFDPHEPFDVPEEYRELYEDGYDGPELYWPGYESSAHYTPEEIHHLRTRYKALATMTDKYLGRLLDVMDAHNLWDDTLLIFTTDHGYMLGEHGYWAKNYMPDYNEIMHIPFVVHHPGIPAGRVNALTQNIDVFPTLLEHFGLSPEAVCRNKIHGKSLLPLLRGETETLRDSALYGQFGKTVSITDGRHVYQRRAVREDNGPLNIYGATLTMLEQYIGYDTVRPEDFAQIQQASLCWTGFPVFRIPANIVNWDNDSLTFGARNPNIGGHRLYDLAADYGQNHPLDDPALEGRFVGMLREQMLAHDTPAEQFERLGME